MGSRKVEGALHVGAGTEAELLPSFQAFSPDFADIRRRYLDAIPVAGAVLAIENDELKLVDCNESYARADSEPGTPPLLERSGFGDLVIEFLAGDENVRDFEWNDGGVIVGRQYSVRIARLAKVMAGDRRCLLTLLDRTAERAAEKSLRLEMFNDSLTGLPNRAGFSDQLETVLEQAKAGTTAVLAVDLTRFSRINESVGDVVGDELLITVARRLLSTMRAGDVLARTGGNEFGVFVRIQDGPEEVLAVAERINAVLTAPCRLSDLEVRVGCAIGCAIFKDESADELIRHAQFALKRAKATGATELYQPRAFDIARQQFTIETRLRRAIEAERLTLAFQPVIELATGKLCGFEALARWHDEGSDIPPCTFIPVAEESGLILPLGRWAMDAAMRTLQAWDAKAGSRLPTPIAVNVSALQVARDDVPGMVEEALARHQIGPNRLVIELTESAIVADPERATKAMDAIRAVGATIALDDFGTGYSNLAYLQRLPIDVLKIDQSFVTGMLGNRDKVAIVRAVLSLAEALGLKTTAEGVETLELSQTLAALGCTRAQGYFYARPLDPDQAFDFWSRSNSAAT